MSGDATRTVVAYCPLCRSVRTLHLRGSLHETEWRGPIDLRLIIVCEKGHTVSDTTWDLTELPGWPREIGPAKDRD